MLSVCILKNKNASLSEEDLSVLFSFYLSVEQAQFVCLLQTPPHSHRPHYSQPAPPPRLSNSGVRL